MKEIREIIRFWEAYRGQTFALATLVAARGSSYRRPGARMLISAAGDSVGGLSAGCIEEEVIAHAREALRDGAPKLLSFDTRLRFGCHGEIDILVEPLREELMIELRECYIQRQRLQLETMFQGQPLGTRIAGFVTDPAAFTQTIQPALRLILLGDNSDTAALRVHGALLGWEIIQIDSAPLPCEIIDDRTAVVIATHHFGRDSAALRNLLPAGLKYLGLIGSRRRRDELLFDVVNDDMPPLSCLFAPAGLHLGAETPDEIALSIIAEIQCVFGAGTAEHLRLRKTPIHLPNSASVACAKSAA